MSATPNKRACIALCTEYPITDFGGTEVLVYALTKGLSEIYDVVLVSKDAPENFGKSDLAPYVKAHIPWQVTPSPLIPAGRALAEELVRLNVDLAHFHFGANFSWGNRALGRTALIHVRRRGIPCLSTNHGVFSLLWGYCAPWRSTLLKLALLPAAWLSKMQSLLYVEREIAVSKHDLRSLQRWYRPLKEKFGQIYHSKITTDPQEPITPMHAREKKILCVGSIGFRKGQEVLAKAFAKIAPKHPDWTLELAGRWGEEVLVEEIKALREKAGLQDRLILNKAPSDDEVLRLLQTSAIFAMPSHHEGLGLSLQEALFYGCACVGSRVEGIPDLIQHEENGLLVPPGDADALAEALECLIANETLRTRYAERGRPSVQEKGMTTALMIKNYASLYDELLAKR